MDQQGFDHWTRAIVTSGTRRAAVRAFAGAAVASLAISRSGEDAGAKCVHFGKRCRRKHDNCCHGAVCRGSRCRCRPGRVWCNGKCVTGQCCQDSDCTAGDTGLCDPQHKCRYRPSCVGAGQDCWFDHQCCSGRCNNLHCEPSGIGEPCRGWSQCQSTVSMECSYYICVWSDDI